MNPTPASRQASRQAALRFQVLSQPGRPTPSKTGGRERPRGVEGGRDCTATEGRREEVEEERAQESCLEEPPRAAAAFSRDSGLLREKKAGDATTITAFPSEQPAATFPPSTPPASAFSSCGAPRADLKLRWVFSPQPPLSFQGLCAGSTGQGGSVDVGPPETPFPWFNLTLLQRGEGGVRIENDKGDDAAVRPKSSPFSPPPPVKGAAGCSFWREDAWMRITGASYRRKAAPSRV